MNQSLKLIYRGEKSSKWLSGEEEIYYLRDLIKKYKTGTENLKKKIMLYDLSKTRPKLTGMGEGSRNIIRNYWQVFPGDFKIRRSSDRPFTYKYSIEFTAIQQEEGQEFNSHGEPPELKEGELGLIQKAMNGLAKALDFIDGINAWVNDVLDKVNQVSKVLKVLGNVMSYSTAALSGMIDSVGDSASGLVNGAASAVSGANSIVSIPREIQLKALNVGLEAQSATNGLMKSTAALVKNCRDMFAEDGKYWEIPQEVLDQYAMNNEEFKDSISIMLDDAENAANELAAAAKSSGIPDVTIGGSTSGGADAGSGGIGTGGAGSGGSESSGDSGGTSSGINNQRIVLSYGYFEAVLKDTDSLESLAAQFYGDPDRAIDIAAYNGAASLSELRPGDKIKIPVTRRTISVINNRIYGRREDRDNYGRDILLDERGRAVPSSTGDFELTKGAKNLTQAILLRLRESVAKRIRLNAYGIRMNIGDQTAGVAYILSSIDLTVRGDPRIASVEDILFSSRGDALNVDVYYTDINNTAGNVTGRA